MKAIYKIYKLYLLKAEPKKSMTEKLHSVGFLLTQLLLLYFFSKNLRTSVMDSTAMELKFSSPSTMKMRWTRVAASRPMARDSFSCDITEMHGFLSSPICS